jgi:hypothetical protein
LELLASDQDEDTGVELRAMRRGVMHGSAAEPPAAGNPAEQGRPGFGSDPETPTCAGPSTLLALLAVQFGNIFR